MPYIFEGSEGPDTKSRYSHCRTGVKGLIKADMVKHGAIVFDVGITWQDERVYGDVDFENVLQR